MLRLLFSLPRPVPSASASLLRLYLRRLFACYAAGTCFLLLLSVIYVAVDIQSTAPLLLLLLVSLLLLLLSFKQPTQPTYRHCYKMEAALGLGLQWGASGELAAKRGQGRGAAMRYASFPRTPR